MCDQAKVVVELAQTIAQAEWELTRLLTSSRERSPGTWPATVTHACELLNGRGDVGAQKVLHRLQTRIDEETMLRREQDSDAYRDILRESASIASGRAKERPGAPCGLHPAARCEEP